MTYIFFLIVIPALLLGEIGGLFLIMHAHWDDNIMTLCNPVGGHAMLLNTIVYEATVCACA